MDNKTDLGGYPIEGTPSEGDYLWFTGARWIPVPWGEEGEVVALASPTFPNMPFTSNGYIVIIVNLQPRDFLCAVISRFEAGYGRPQEYITNIPFISDKLRATDQSCIIDSVDGGLNGGNLGTLSIVKPTNATYTTLVT